MRAILAMILLDLGLADDLLLLALAQWLRRAGSSMT